MKTKYWVVALILMPLYAFSQTHDNANRLNSSVNPKNKNSEVITYSNESNHFQQQKSSTRSQEYPTQIIRMEHNIENLQLTCKEVHDQIDKILVKHIMNPKFIYSIYISCEYSRETRLALRFIINSYFDPLTDEAISYLESYLGKYNNTDLMGTQYKIEPAKGLIVSLGISAGLKKIITSPVLIEYRKDRSNFYFKNNYEMRTKLFNDITQNFFTNDPNIILPFLNKWIAPYASSIYKSVLRDSNYVELQPEKIFLMNEEDIFVSAYKQYIANNCETFENHRCLNPEKTMDNEPII